MNEWLKLVAVLLVSLGAWGCDAAGPAPGVGDRALPPRGGAWVILGSDTVVVEIADEQAERQQGLMSRARLDAGTGMLFVFEDEAFHAFYMRNTLIPLDIAWMDESQVIVDIQQMEPETEELHTPAQAALFALEVPQGWFAEMGIEVGDLAQIVFGRP